MRLELVVSKDIIKRKFDISDKYNKVRERLNENTLVVSNQLLKAWEQDSKDNNYETQFQNWYFSLINSKKKFKKVKARKYSKVKNANHEDKILIATALASRQKISIGNMDINTRRKNKSVLFVSEGTFMREQSQTVTMKDVRDVLIQGKTHSIFDIYETPVRLEIELNSESKILGLYLSKFLEKSKNIRIKDRYILQPENERNLNKYILKYIDRDHSTLTFIISSNQDKPDVVDKFTNYSGYKSKIEFVDKKQTHHSSIESDEYIIDIGYRLRVFGDKDDGKTEEEVINITKK